MSARKWFSRSITTRYESTCALCAARIAVGRKVAWDPTINACAHHACARQANEAGWEGQPVRRARFGPKTANRGARLIT